MQHKRLYKDKETGRLTVVPPGTKEELKQLSLTQKEFNVLVAVLGRTLIQDRLNDRYKMYVRTLISKCAKV